MLPSPFSMLLLFCSVLLHISSEIVKSRGLQQLENSDELSVIVDGVLAKNSALVARYRAGNANLFGALVGLVMRETQNRANPTLVGELLRKRL